MLLDLEGFVPVGLTEICGLQINSWQSQDYQTNKKRCRSVWLIMIWLSVVRYMWLIVMCWAVMMGNCRQKLLWFLDAEEWGAEGPASSGFHTRIFQVYTVKILEFIAFSYRACSLNHTVFYLFTFFSCICFYFIFLSNW